MSLFNLLIIIAIFINNKNTFLEIIVICAPLDGMYTISINSTPSMLLIDLIYSISHEGSR